jgi:methionine-rich copper-binding protein CopC
MNGVKHFQSLLHRSLVLIALLGFMVNAQAHTGLKESNPAAGALLRVAPEQIQLVFTATVSLVRFTLSDHEGRRIDVAFKPDPESKTEFLLPIPALLAGHYQVEWAVIGADGHTVTDKFAFVVDPSAEAEHSGQHSGGGHSH